MRMLLQILNKNSFFITVVTVLGVLNSFLFGALIILVNNRIQGNGSFIGAETDEWLLFFSLMGLSFICRKWFQYRMIRFTNEMLFDFEINLLEKIRDTDYEKFQGMETAKVYTAIGDIRTVSQVPRYFIDMVNNAILVLVSLGYLIWLAPLAGILVIGFGFLLGVFYFFRNRYVIQWLRRSRELENRFFDYLGDFLEGYKYVKLSRRKEKGLFNEHLAANRNEARDAEINASVLYTNNEMLGSYGWLFILGVPVFVLPYLSSTAAILTGSVTIIILYLMGPVSALISSIPFFARIQVSLERLKTFSAEIRALDKDPAHETLSAATVFQTIVFDNVGYQYHNNGNGKQFALGPLSLEIKRGEIVFITGDNGSGKSTFLLLLSGLMNAQTGNLLVDGMPVTAHNAAQWRNQVSAVYVEGFLFKHHYETRLNQEDEENFKKFIRLVKLEHLGLKNCNDRSRKLSRGQQKRMALVQALMEEKDLLILDEWAAEQDPSFRRYFYTAILPELQRMGKTIVAVTHDDRYFHLASRLYHFSAGKLADSGTFFLQHDRPAV